MCDLTWFYFGFFFLQSFSLTQVLLKIDNVILYNEFQFDFWSQTKKFFVCKSFDLNLLPKTPNSFFPFIINGMRDWKKMITKKVLIFCCCCCWTLDRFKIYRFFPYLFVIEFLFFIFFAGFRWLVIDLFGSFTPIFFCSFWWFKRNFFLTSFFCFYPHHMWVCELDFFFDSILWLFDFFPTFKNNQKKGPKFFFLFRISKWFGDGRHFFSRFLFFILLNTIITIPRCRNILGIKNHFPFISWRYIWMNRLLRLNFDSFSIIIIIITILSQSYVNKRNSDITNTYNVYI